MDRNISPPVDTSSVNVSLSARRAWIEISIDDLEPSSTRVALRKESVDRNGYFGCNRKNWVIVALRKESVDRNLAVWAVEHAYQVALRKESVDRNWLFLPSWILFPVALRKESVDRNYPHYPERQ